MPIKVKTKIDFAKVKPGILDQINERVIAAFKQSCRDAIAFATDSDRLERYTDQTGALKASTGFQLYQNGKLVYDMFGDGNTEGAGAGRNEASASSAKNDGPVVAIMVAGMPYAVYVESKGKDVLTGAMLKMPELLTKYMREFFEGTGIDYSVTT